MRACVRVHASVYMSKYLCVWHRVH